jgi:hypothetical protein
VTADVFESTIIYAGRMLYSISFCKCIHPQGIGKVCYSVESLTPNIQFGIARLLYLGFMHTGQVAILEIFNWDVDCLVEVTTCVSISRLDWDFDGT